MRGGEAERGRCDAAAVSCQMDDYFWVVLPRFAPP